MAANATDAGGNAATVNSNIYDAFVAGYSEEGAATIANVLTPPYIQATLRYLNKMDNDVGSGISSSGSGTGGCHRSRPTGCSAN